MRHDESHLLLGGNGGETLGTRCDTESDAHSSAHLTQRNSRLINDDRKSRLMHGLGRVSRLLRATRSGRCRTEEARLLGGILHIEATADEEIQTRNLPWGKSAHRCTTVTLLVCLRQVRACHRTGSDFKLRRPSEVWEISSVCPKLTGFKVPVIPLLAVVVSRNCLDCWML